MNNLELFEYWTTHTNKHGSKKKSPKNVFKQWKYKVSKCVDAVRSVLWGKFIPLNKERFKIKWSLSNEVCLK